MSPAAIQPTAPRRHARLAVWMAMSVVLLGAWLYTRSSGGDGGTDTDGQAAGPNPPTAEMNAEIERTARQRAERERADKLYEGVRLLKESNDDAEKSGIDSVDCADLVSRAGIPAVRHYLAMAKLPFDAYQKRLAYQIVWITSEKSVYETLMIAEEVGLGGEIVSGKIHSRLVAKCLKDRDRDAHEFLQEFPVIKRYMAVSEHDYSSDGDVIEILVQAELSFSDIVTRYRSVSRPDSFGAISVWIFSGGVNRMVAASGDLQRILGELGSIDPMLRSFAIGKLEESGVSKRVYLERNSWIKGEDLKAYVRAWAIAQTNDAMDWLKGNDRGLLPHTVREVCPFHHSRIKDWIERQSDPEIKTVCEKALTSWEKAERKKEERKMRVR
ncbi:MAG: hypothetical protein J0M04_24570 [Verrucomicrobia bacterium]|nr:hypothetical protein [Verrucomicrobiota bacterium]